MSDQTRSVTPDWYDDGSGRQRWWSGQSWTDQFRDSDQPIPPAPSPSSAQSVQSVPGRVSGFVLGIISVLFMTTPILTIPLSIIGWVLSAKALRRLPAGRTGRGLAMAGLILSISALVITSLIFLSGHSYLFGGNR